jgi:Flp pilus assembly protein TadG
MIRVRRRGERGQSLVEFALILPLLLIIVLGIVEVSYLLLDQHVVSRLAREGSNLISRDVSLGDAAAALRTMSTRPVDFDASSKVIFSVIKKGSTTGTTNYNQNVLYARYEYGVGPSTSAVQTRGGGTFGTDEEHTASNADSDSNLQVTSLPSNAVPANGMLYVTEIYSRHTLLTPFNRLGFNVPQTLYSIAYF